MSENPDGASIRKLLEEYGQEGAGGSIGCEEVLVDCGTFDPVASKKQDNKTDFELLPSIIASQSLLAQFGSQKVRADLVNGQFRWHISSGLLPKIDQLGWNLFPRWTEGDLDAAKSRSKNAANHFKKLVAGDKTE
jgi:hypothetical protein